MPSAQRKSEGRSFADVVNGNGLLQNGVLVFDNGFIDPVDCSGIPGETWNWRVNNATDFEAGNIVMRSKYVTPAFSEERFGLDCAAEEGLTGLSVNLARSLKRWGRFGIDAGLSVTYFDKVKIMDVVGRVYGKYVSEDSGEVLRKIDASGFVGDPDLVNPDGTIGAGTFDGPGPILAYGTVEQLVQGSTEIVGGGRTVLERTEMVMSVEGDYSEMGFEMVARPYYEIVDGLRIKGSIGIGCAAREVSIDGCAMVSGREVWRKSEDFSETSLYGILGAMLEYGVGDSFFLECGIETLLGGCAMDVNGDFVNGEIKQGKVDIALGVGYRF